MNNNQQNTVLPNQVPVNTPPAPFPGQVANNPAGYPSQTNYPANPNQAQMQQIQQPQQFQQSQPMPTTPQAGQITQVIPSQAIPTVPNQAEKPKSNPNSTQNTLQIAEIRDGLLILKDGTFRAVIACESINFDLMSQNEREGVEYSYQNFLNSLYFPIQISIRSQRVDIGPYLEKLAKIRNSQDNMLLNVLMDDYINYIEVIAQEANIMEKSFFIVIPYMPAGDIDSAKTQIQGIFSKAKNTPTTNIKINQQVYAKGKEELEKRINLILNGLMQIGIHAERLDTKKLSQLYYDFYNPDTALRQPFVSFDKLGGLYTKKGVGEAPRMKEEE